MIKLAYIYRLLLVTGLFLTIIAMPKMSANNHVSKKTEFNAGNHNLLRMISNENLIADIVDNEINDVDFFHQHDSIISKSNTYRFGDLLNEKETSHFAKLQVPFHKFPHLFILFHCWKYLCL